AGHDSWTRHGLSRGGLNHWQGCHADRGRRHPRELPNSAECLAGAPRVTTCYAMPGCATQKKPVRHPPTRHPRAAQSRGGRCELAPALESAGIPLAHVLEYPQVVELAAEHLRARTAEPLVQNRDTDLSEADGMRRIAVVPA